MRRKRSRKRGRWDGFPSGEEEKGGGEMEVEEEDDSTRENGGSGGKMMKVKEKKGERRERERKTDRIQRLSLQTPPLVLWFFPCCATQGHTRKLSS